MGQGIIQITAGLFITVCLLSTPICKFVTCNALNLWHRNHWIWLRHRVQPQKPPNNAEVRFRYFSDGTILFYLSGQYIFDVYVFSLSDVQKARKASVAQLWLRCGAFPVHLVKWVLIWVRIQFKLFRTHRFWLPVRYDKRQIRRPLFIGFEWTHTEFPL